MTHRRSTCIATVTSRGYEVGTAVLLSSILARNPGLDATFVILHDGLGARAARHLTAIPGVELVRIGDPLRARLNALCIRYPELRRWAPRFHSLEAFSLKGFERVLFLDSDVLCIGEVEELISEFEGLYACTDRARRAGAVRDATSFLPANPGEARSEQSLEAFNSGVLLIGSDVLEGDSYEALLATLTETDWARVRSGHTDQFVLNHLFRDRWRPLPERFNKFIAPVGAEPIVGEGGEHDVANAVFLHFVGRIKPWTGRVGPDWRRSAGDRRAALREWDRTRMRWALECARRGDMGPLLDIAQRQSIRMMMRILSG